MKLSPLEEKAKQLVEENPGITMIGIAAAINIKHPIYGKQRAASRAIARLRKGAFIKDVARRCPKCHRALTRNLRNVPLYPANYDGEQARDGWLF